MKTGRMRRFKSICVLLSLIVLVIGGGRSPTTVMADDTKIVEAIGSSPCWSGSGSWNSWKNWFTGKGYTINGSGKTTLWWNKKDYEAWWLGVQDKNGNQKWALLFDGVQTTSGNYITRYNGWMPVREGNDIAWYYLDSEGLTYTNTWLHTRCVDANYKSSDKHGYFYFDKNGRLQTGWLQDSSGKWYYSDSKEGSINPGISEHGGLAWTVIKNPTSYEKDGLYSNGLYYLSGLNVVTNVYRMNTNGTYDYVGDTVNNIKVGDGDDQINPLKEKTINADTDYVNKQIYNSKGLFINTNAEGSCNQQQNLALKNNDYKQIKVNEFIYYIDRKKFTLTQNINSDTETTKTLSIYFEDALTIENPSAKTGYTFAAWDLQGNGSKLNDRTFVMGDEDAILTAQWTPVNYSISYSLNGGSLSGQKTSYNIETANFTLPTPTRTGYTFTGWTGSNGTTAQKSVTIAKGSTGDKSYTANWTPVNYTISYNANGGSISGQKTSYNIETANFTLPTPTRNGYTFTGWTGTGLSSATKSITVSKGSTGNRSYTANWSASDYTVSFNYNKPSTATGTMSGNGTTNKGVAYAAAYGTLPQPSIPGWTFNGWYTAASGGSKISATTTYTAAGNQTLYAHWTMNTYSISYNTNGGSLSDQKTSYNVNTDSFTLPTPTKNGYTFTGWTGSNGTTAQKSVTIAKGSTGNKSFTANWTPTNYSISYSLNGGSISGQKTSYNIETANFTLPTPSKSGYTFTGWTGTGLSGLTKTVTVSKGSAGNRNYTAHFEKTVTAMFKYYNNQTVTVTGKITDSATSVAVKAPAASGTPSGYTFRGWSTNSAANASVNAAASASVTISGNATYYASYSKSVTATFYYCMLAADNYTYANGAQGSAAASATQYLGYIGTVVNSNISIPSAVTASHGGASAQNYAGVSKDTNNASTVTPTTAYTKYYAVYTEPLKFYYYNGTTDTSTSVTRRMLSNGSTYSNSLSASAPAPAAYDGAAFAWWSYDSGVSDSSSLRKPLETGVNSLYAVYKKNVSISYNANGGSGAPAAQSGIKYYAKKESGGNNITNPSITVTGSKPSRNGYNFSSWNTSANGSGTVYKAGTSYTVSANVTLYAQWQYNPVSVKVPQVLTGDHTGRSQFRVKCDDFKAGNIKVTVPNSFLYKQTGKADVTATITAKNGNNTITPSNKACVYNITTTSGLSAGCWSGSFNIGLTLTKE